MKKKAIWLVVSCLIVVAVLVTSCAPALTEKEEIVATEGEELVTGEEQEVIPQAQDEVAEQEEEVAPTEEEVVQGMQHQGNEQIPIRSATWPGQVSRLGITIRIPRWKWFGNRLVLFSKTKS